MLCMSVLHWSGLYFFSDEKLNSRVWLVVLNIPGVHEL